MFKKTAPSEFALKTVPQVLIPRPIDEAVRQKALESLNILDTAPEERLDLITRMAQELFGVETCAISLIDNDRQWFKSRIGLAVEETSRSVAFCDHTIRQYDTMVIPDAHVDSRFQTNPLVTGDPHIRFYAGYPIEVANGQPIGAFCIIDPKPRILTEKEKDLLRDLALIAQNELAAIVAASSDPVSSFTLDGIITSWNLGAERLFGYTADEMIGQSYLAFVPSERAVESAELREKATRGQSILNYESVRVRKDGRAVPVSLTISPTYDQTGAVKGVSVLYRDMTELKKLETRNTLLASIVADSNDAIMSESLDGVITSWNPAAERIYGYSAEEMIGQTFSNLIPSQNRQQENQLWATIHDGHLVKDLETVRIRKNGSAFPASLTMSPILDLTGAIIGTSTIVRDLTDRKMAEQNRSSQFTRSLLEASLDALTTISPAGKITDVNDATIKITGVGREALIGTDFPSYFTEPDKARAIAKQVVTAGSVTNYPLTVRHTNGKLTDILFSASMYKDVDGNVIGLFGSGRDMTEFNKKEQQVRDLKEMNELRNEFVAVVTHDQRSPMTSISGYAHLLIDMWDTTSDDEKIEYLRVIARNTENLAHFVEDALQVARIESGGYTYEIKPFDLRSLVQRALGEADGSNVDRRFEFTTSGDIDLVLGDEDRQWQVLTNLLSNAVKFSPAEEPITVGLSRNGDAIQVAITDRGIGIATDDIVKLFQKFGRVSQSGGGNVPGNGLGLYICKTLVEAQGGRIWCESSPGRGSTFFFTIPVSPSTQEAYFATA